MPTSPFRLSRVYPGSQTCVCIGRLGAQAKNALRGYGAILWLVDKGVEVTLPEPSVCIGVEELDQAVLEAKLSAFVALQARHLPSVFVSTEIPSSLEAEYEKAAAVVFCSLEEQHRSRVTREEDGYRWQHHLLQNTTDFLEHLVPEDWCDKLHGLPAIVCGAGPSLDASISALLANRGRAVLFAADSSLKALAARGIWADFAVSVDVAKTPERCLPGEAELQPRRVVLSAVSPPTWKERTDSSARSYLTSNLITLDWFSDKGVPATPSRVCENCGATAISLAKFMGCSPIVLFGMDLALAPGKTQQRHHGAVDAAVYANSGFDAEKKHPLVPGNFSEQVPTHVLGDLRTLNQRLISWPAGLVHVVTDRGARLDNTTVHRPEQWTGFSSDAESSPLNSLAVLGAPREANRAALNGIRSDLLEVVSVLEPRLQELRADLARGDCTLITQKLRLVFSDPRIARPLGSFSFKLMPYLLPPVELRTEKWQELLSELEALVLCTKKCALSLPA